MKKNARTGFSLIDALALVTTLTTVSAIAAPTLHGAWRNRMAAGSASNLRIISTGSAMFSAMNDDLIPTYTWEAGVRYTLPNGTVSTPGTDLDAAHLQNRAILMEMTGRISIEDTFRMMTQRLPHRRFVHLPLWQFMGEKMSAEVFVDPLDSNTLVWHRDPTNIGPTSTVPYSNGDPGFGYDGDTYWETIAQFERWGYSTSYFTVPTAWLGQGSELQYRPFFATNHLFVHAPNVHNRPLHLGNQMSDIAFPSSKVYMHEEYDRRQSVPTYFAYDHAAPMKLMFDGSLNVQTSGEANSSYDPVDDTPWRQTYLPLDTYPLPFGGAGDQTQLDFRYRWTRFGLSGIDYTPLSGVGSLQ